MDRSIMEGDPHKMIEGMMIGGLCGRSQRRLYLRESGISAGDQPFETGNFTGRGKRSF